MPMSKGLTRSLGGAASPPIPLRESRGIRDQRKGAHTPTKNPIHRSSPPPSPPRLPQPQAHSAEFHSVGWILVLLYNSPLQQHSAHPL